MFLFLAIWTERIFAGLRIKKRLVLALIIALAATIMVTFQLLVILALSALTILWIATLPTRPQRILYGGVAAAIALLVFVGYFGGPRAKRYDYEVATQAGDVARTVTMKTAAVEVAAQPAYQGLPAKFTLPTGARWSNFSEDLLRTDRAQRARVVAVSMTVIKVIGFAIALLALLLLWRSYRDIRDAIRERIASREQPVTVTDAAAAP